jgi:zinc ribbon protein
MTMGISSCPKCGAPVQQNTSFCANCGTKITSSSSQPPQPPQAYYGPAPVPQPPISTGPYKAVIAVLLIVIIVLGIGYYEASAGHLPISLGTNRYQLTNPPNLQSTQPPPSFTAQSPYYTIWNACGSSQSAGCTMNANGWREGSVPDTFDYYVSFTSNVNVTVYFFTMGQFVQFSVCNGDVTCVSGSYDSIPATTNSPPYTMFTLGEGCADYLAIYVASGTGIMHPNVGVTSHPASSATGYCAQVGG